MNNNCVKVCKHAEYCRLDMVQTMQCKCSDAEVNEAFNVVSGDGDIFGYTYDQIAAKQGIKKLKK